MEKEIKNQEYQWVLRIDESYYDEFDEDTKYEKIFATEEDALNNLKEYYEYVSKKYEIYDSELDLKEHNATCRIKYNDEIVGRVNMWIKKQKSDYLDMTVEEYWDKVEFLYGSEQIGVSSAEAYETDIFLSELLREDWIHISPYYISKFKVFYYGMHPDDCIYHLQGEGFNNDYYHREYYRETKMREVIQDIKNEDAKYYTTIMSNIKEITDAGCKYIIDINRDEYIFGYIFSHQNEYKVEGHLEDSIYTITALNTKSNDDYEEDEENEEDIFDVKCPMCGEEFECEWSDFEIENDRYYYVCDNCGTRIRQF
jgi:DNA-directed RNA polymerase subunit RPC12/RpoP